ncbi:MAG: YncE family protein [Deltaproteobacteria bacterium]|nr:YncE family protein [Deltaproteobacteria bacterium]
MSCGRLAGWLLVLPTALAWAPGAAARAADYAVTDSAWTGSMPKAVLLSPDGERAYVTNFGRRGSRNVSVYRTADLEEVGQVDFAGNGVEMAVTGDGRTLYVSNFRRALVEIVDTASLTVTAEVPVGRNPKTMALSADEQTLYVSNWSSNDVSVVDLATRTETRRFRVGAHPRGIAVTEAGTLIVGNHADDTLSFLDAATGDPRFEPVGPGGCPRHVILSPDERWAYVSAQSTGQVVRLDAATGEVVARWDGGRNLKTIDVTADGRYVFTTVNLGTEVGVIDTEDGTTRYFTVRGIEKPSGLDVTPDGKRVYVTGWLDCHLYVLERREPAPGEAPAAE